MARRSAFLGEMATCLLIRAPFRLPGWRGFEKYTSILYRSFSQALTWCLSVQLAPSESRRCAAPRIAGACLCTPVFEQLHHVVAIELNRMRLLEVVSDVSELEADAIPLR
jgi:hypothetical protein